MSAPRRYDHLGRQPGDPTAEEARARMIRVDHAGEYGAKRIYAGQLAVLGDHASIRHMAVQEQKHLEAFEKLMGESRVRPTVLTPLWHVAGFALGAATALLGEKAAMACTEAVESVIDEHYQRQAEALEPGDAALKSTIEQFRAEEIEHKETAIAAGAHEAPAYPVLTGAIKQASRLAIWLSERI
ncbi:demethoxyubiquinone hydroxylase family protein [Desertibaculum subflavum]|uniref:demethoxyubiquinone hydroxylase family protein n=1 Tax=Desertibaculum subflavum TaxID=2268458 RepID=UPI000E671729